MDIKRDLLIAAKLSIVVVCIIAVIISLVTANREYFRGLVFAACIFNLALRVREADSK